MSIQHSQSCPFGSGGKSAKHVNTSEYSLSLFRVCWRGKSAKRVNTAESVRSLLWVCWRRKSAEHVNTAQSCPFVGGERVLNM